MSSEVSLKKLLDGNKRFVESKLSHPRREMERRQELLAGQQPFAAILSCSDSRVPPEIIFDQGLGDLFVVRTAGNVVDDLVLGSLEYAVEHLKVPLIVVMGHEKCGAVSAATHSEKAQGHISRIIEKIAPVVEAVKNDPGDLIENAVIANVRKIVSEIKCNQPVLAELVEMGKIDIRAAYYVLETGKAVFI